ETLRTPNRQRDFVGPSNVAADVAAADRQVGMERRDWSAAAEPLLPFGPLGEGQYGSKKKMDPELQMGLEPVFHIWAAERLYMQHRRTNCSK
ncbi:hypothetical protein U1Q18_051272, partial [Sarracenia purpurea var. burkii]